MAILGEDMTTALKLVGAVSWWEGGMEWLDRRGQAALIYVGERIRESLRKDAKRQWQMRSALNLGRGLVTDWADSAS